MSKLVIDIETVGESFESFDAVTKEALTKWIKKDPDSGEIDKAALEEIKNGLGLSPLTGKICAIGVLDCDQNRGVIYFDAEDSNLPESEQGNFKFKPMDEASMLKNFWEGAKNYDTFITFNGRGFDIPFIIARSAAHGVKITRDLMSNRYLNGQRGPSHIDLLDQLSFYGAVKRSSLHLWCRALGIESPKQAGVSGNDVAELFAAKKYLDIARYNTRDLEATKELYEKWSGYMLTN